MESSPAVRARGITKYFGDVVALDGVDLDIPSGQVHGLVGPNGAGKTTLLGLLLGLAVADKGTLEILGTPVDRVLAVPDGVAGFVDGPGLYPSLTARQNLAALAALRGGDRRDAADEVDDALEQVGLTDVADDRVRGFSLGHASAARPGRRPADQAAAAGARRAVQRPRPGRQAARAPRAQPSSPPRAPRSCSPATRWTTSRPCAPRSRILATGRVVFSGPVSKLAAESGRLDYRLRHLRRGRRPPGRRRRRPGSTLVPGAHALEPEDGAVVVRGPVRRRRRAGRPARRRRRRGPRAGPVVSPLEAAFLALTGDGDSRQTRRQPMTATIAEAPAPSRRPVTRPGRPVAQRSASSWSSCSPSGGSASCCVACWVGPALLRRRRQPAELAAQRHRLRPLDARHRLGRPRWWCSASRAPGRSRC